MPKSTTRPKPTRRRAPAKPLRPRSDLSRYFRAAVAALDRWERRYPGLRRDIEELCSGTPDTPRDESPEEIARAGCASADLSVAILKWYPKECDWLDELDFDEQVEVLDKTMYFVVRANRWLKFLARDRA